MPIQIGAKPEASFREPIGVLTDCHRRVEKFLETLALVARARNGAPLDGEHRSAFENALRYFREAAPKHTADEEDSLFPRLRARPGASEVLSKVDELESDHVRAGVAHLDVERLGRRWLDRGSLSTDEADQLIRVLEALKDLYREHIAIEEGEVFPFALRVLDPSELRTIGLEMGERRGLN